MQDYSLFNHILRPFFKEDLIIGKKYSSPLKGRRDSSPSFSVNEYKGKLYYKDFGAVASGTSPVNLLMDIHDISYGEACDLIESADFPAVNPKTQRTKNHNLWWDNLNYSELLWWEQYHITLPTLRKYKVFGARQMISDGEVSYDWRKDSMAFVYLGETKDVWQFYKYKTPASKKRFQRKGSFLLGYEQLPLTGKKLFISSSMKDGLCLREAGEWFISGAGETDSTNIASVLPELRLRFREIFILLDPDAAGKKAELRLQEKLNLPIFPFPYPNDSDDIADLTKNYGIKWLKNALHMK